MTAGSKLYIDLETYSEADIGSTGSYRYIEDDSFEIILIAYAYGDEPVRLIELDEAGELRAPEDLIEALNDPGIIKVAHNAAFERIALGKYTGRYMPLEQWEDTMIKAAYNGLPMSLDAVGEALMLKDKKMREGKALINYFCKPCKPTIANGGRMRNFPWHNPEKWRTFCEYCIRDVEVARSVDKRLSNLVQPEWERSLQILDTEIVERGVLIDQKMVEAALAVDEEFRQKHEAEMKKLTGLDNPNSLVQLKGWLAEQGIEIDSLSKGTMDEVLAQAHDPITRRVLEIRRMLGKTSTTKYEVMKNAACKDSRVRGILQYYGASRTGRWA